MRRTKRLIPEVILALFVFAVLSIAGTAPAVSAPVTSARPVKDAAPGLSMSVNTPIPGLVWALATAATGVVTVFRRRKS